MTSKVALVTLVYGLTNMLYINKDLGITMDKCLEIIEKDLERKEKLEKVWKICKKKRVSMVNIYYTDYVEEYNGAIGTEIALTETEFNLIKEAFGNDK